MRKYKAVLFDLDGTLVHTPDEYRQLVVEGILAELGIKDYPDWFVDQFWFKGNREKTVRDALAIEPSIFFACYQHHDTRARREQWTRVFPDVGYLATLKEMGYKIGAVTGGSPHVMEVNINLLGKEYFDVTVSANPQAAPPLPPKPNPAGLNTCLQKLDVRPDEAFYVGNGEEDVGAAKRAGMLDVLILRGEHAPPTAASVTITSLYCLRPLLWY